MGQRRLVSSLAVLAGFSGFGGVAPGEELAALGQQEEGELGERPLRRGERGGEEGRQVVEEPRGRRLGEEVGVVGEPQPDAADAATVISLAAGLTSSTYGLRRRRRPPGISREDRPSPAPRWPNGSLRLSRFRPTAFESAHGSPSAQRLCPLTSLATAPWTPPAALSWCHHREARAGR